ncbi:MAG: lysophospholipid acyltransferase family protein [Pseudomonadota bacterium]
MPLEKSQLSTSRKSLYFMTNIFMSGMIGAMRLLPYTWRIPAMGWLSATVAPWVGFSRRVRENLHLVRPDLSEAEVKKLCKSVPDNAGRSMMEHFSPAEFQKRTRNAPITGPGLQALEDARAAGKPVLIVTGHFGNYAAARSALQSRGHVIGALYRRMANPFFNDHYVRCFAELGEPNFAQGRRGMTELVRFLRSGNTVAIVSDLHALDGVDLDFFGKPAQTSLKNAQMALKYGAVLIPVYAVRQPDGLSFTVEMHAPIAHSDARTMTQEINDGLEDLVRRHMDQWFWIHRRWKAATG